MRLSPFKLERFFARHEFTAPFLLCASDLESLTQQEVLDLADEECRELWRTLKLGYTESAGHPKLRAEIASLYPGVAPGEVLVANPEEAIFLFMNAVLGPGDHAVAVWPSYQSLHEVARGTGAEVTLLKLAPEEGWRLDVGALRAALRPTTRVIVINFPHNPTGALIDRATFSAVVELAREAGAWLFSDEVYRLLEEDPAERLPAAVEWYERAVSLGAMSKAFALAGLRIGWLATHDADVLRRVAELKDYTTICSSAPSELLALAALRAREAVLARSLALLRDNLALLDRFFGQHAERFEWVRPRAGSVGFPRLRGNRPIEQFAEELLQREGVMLLPGSTYDFPGNYFRLGFGRKNLAEALARLERFLGPTAGRS